MVGRSVCHTDPLMEVAPPPKNRFGDYVLTREASLAPGATILVYRDKATVQVYSSRSITGPSKVLTKTLQLTKLCKKTSGTSHERVVSEFLH